MHPANFNSITVESLNKLFDNESEYINPYSITECIIKATGTVNYIPRELIEFLITEEEKFENNRIMYLMIHISILVLVSSTLKKSGIEESSTKNKIKESWEELINILENYD